jgi:nucleotide-binding universal stress UspA family protein
MYQTILVPLDGSRLAEWALPVAVHVARQTGASLQLVTIQIVLPTMGVSAGLATETWDPAAYDATLDYLKGVAQRIAAVHSGAVTTTVRTGHGRGASTLLRHSKEAGADLIVLATHGYGPLKRLWLGSFADTVARRARIPVVLIRPQRDEEVDLSAEPHFQRILVPLDGSAAAATILEHSIAIGKGPLTEYTLFQSLSPIVGIGPEYLPVASPYDPAILRAREDQAKRYLEQSAEELRARRLRVQTVVTAEAFAAGAILDYAEANAMDLITLTTHGHGGPLRLILGSVSDKVVRGAAIPVLLYRPPSRPA